MAIEDVLIRMREATTEINRATDDPRMKASMEKSWTLQDRVVLTGRVCGMPVTTVALLISYIV